MALEFKTVAKPVLKRVDNPFIAVVSTLVPNSEDARTFELPNKSKDDAKAIRVALRQLTEAGNENNVTVRRNVVDHPEKTEITFWAVSKIVHNNEKETAEELAELKAEVVKEVEAKVAKAISKKG